MDGTGETAAQRVTDLQAQLAAAEAEAAAEAGGAKPADSPVPAVAAAEQAAEGDGKQAAEGQPAPTAEGTGSVAAAPEAAAAVEQPKGILEALKELPASEGSPHDFIERLRAVAGQLVEDGQLVEADLVGPAEARVLNSTVIRLVGELVAKL